MTKRNSTIIGVLMLGLALAAVALLVRQRLSLSEEELRANIVSTVQREATASFLVTGTLDIVATTTVENTRQLLPGLLDVSLGTSTATVQIPGRAHYGFDVRKLKPEHITLLEDDVVEVRVPIPEVYSVEPNLSELRVRTSRGWLRTGESTQRAERRALALINGALQRQARIHLAGSMQPQVNTSKALQQLLTPVLRSMGVNDPVFRFRIGEQILIEPAGR